MGSDIDLLYSRASRLLDDMRGANLAPYERKSLPDCSTGDLVLIMQALSILGAIRSAVGVNT